MSGHTPRLMRAVAALMTTAMRGIGRDTDAFTLALKNGFVFIDWDRAPLTPGRRHLQGGWISRIR